MQMELDRYTSMPNPLPRPPEIVPLVTNLTRDHAASSVHSSQHGVASLGLGPAPTQAQPTAPDRATAPTAQSRSSSGGSRARAPSVHFAGSASSGHHQAIDGEVLREEPAKHRHFIVPGAPPSRRVIPPRLTDSDSDITPRAPITAVQHPPQVLSSRHINWPPHLQEYAPQPGKPCVWLGPPGVPHEVLPNEVPLESLYTPARAGPSSQPPLDNSDIPPVIPSPPVPPTMTARAATETGSARLRVDPPEGPLSGRSPMAWRPVPAHQEGSVMVYLPEIGITWLPEDQAARLPVRARGTVCRFAYVIAKEPSEVDDERRRAGDGASPPSTNPLQLSGVPQAPVAGPSTSVVQRGGYDPIPGPSTAVSTLFLNSERTGNASASSSSSSLSGLGLLAPASSNSRSTRTQSSRNTGDPLGLNLASFPEPGRSATQRSQEDSEAERSPASSWGTLPSMPSRHSSLGNLHLNNLPNPQPFARSTDSLDQLPIGELNGGPIVLTDAVTPRQGSLLFGDDRSVASGRSEPSRSRRGEPSGLLNPSAGSSRQVVSSMQDLEGVNRSLMQLADSQDTRDPEPRRGSRPSTRHSRQPSMTGDERDAMVGLRTGLALYSSRPVAQQPSNYPSGSPSSDEPPSSAQSRPRSGASTRSHAESAYSSYSHRSSHSHHSSQSMQSNQSVHSGGSHRSSDASRPRRSSTVSALDGVRGRDAYETPSWTTVPADTQSYHSSRDGYSSDSRSRKSQESIPRAMEGLGSGPTSMSSLLLSFDPPSTSSAVTESGEEAAGIHAPRPVNGRRSSLFGGAWNARSGR